MCAAFVVLLGAVAYAELPGAGEAVAYLLPPLLLLLALAARWYPGEQALLRLLGSRRACRRPGDRGTECRPRPRAFLPRGGCLIASSLAVRPPPLASVLS
jgi:hypothetical protein